MRYVMLEAEERSILQPGAPSTAQIVAALQSVDLQGGVWVAPTPRITRRMESLALGANVTTVAALASIPDSLSDTALYTQVMGAFEALAPGNWITIVAAYAPAVNGTLEWWQSGQASISRTQTDWPEFAGRLDANENPVGPTTDATHPRTVADAVAGASGVLAELLLAAAVLGAVYVASETLPRRKRDASPADDDASKGLGF
jgi:hypothetical protein